MLRDTLWWVQIGIQRRDALFVARLKKAPK
jgi:hypothetical protein